MTFIGWLSLGFLAGYAFALLMVWREYRACEKTLFARQHFGLGEEI